jgi:hypothetical protein
MHRFKLLSAEVSATQIDDNGIAIVGGRKLIGNTGFWVVVNRAGDITTWSDEEFRETFEPADGEAKAYLKACPRKRRVQHEP